MTDDFVRKYPSRVGRCGAALGVVAILFSVASVHASADDGSVITTVAGNGTQGYAGDGGPATSAELNNPEGARLDSLGNLYISDAGNCRIRKVNPAGVISTIVGNGTCGSSGVGGPATNAELNEPGPVVVDSSGDIYIPDTFNCRVLEVISTSGVVVSVAGNGTCGPTAAELNEPYDVALDSAGNLYIADYLNNRIQKRSSIDGTVATYAGNGTAGFAGDGGPATTAEMNKPVGLAMDAADNLYIADSGNQRVRKVNAAGIITTIAGNGSTGYSGDGGPATNAALNAPISVAVTASGGDLYIADYSNNAVRRVGPAGGISTVAGDGVSGCSGDGGAATSAQLDPPRGLGLDSSGNLYIADYSCQEVRKATRPIIEADLTAAGVTLPVLGSISGSPDGSGGYVVVVTLDGTTLPPIDVFTDGQVTTPITQSIGGTTPPIDVWVSAFVTGHVTCLLSIGAICAVPVPIDASNPTTGEALSVRVCTPTPDNCLTRSIPF